MEIIGSIKFRVRRTKDKIQNGNLEIIRKKDIVFWFALFSSIFLCGYVLVRAYALGFTHDEGITYTIVKFSSGWKDTANNHLLNTWLMNICSKIFGDSELSLRLPNLLSYPFYLFFSFLISKKINNQFLAITSFILLNFNPFVLEFFSLARGYGISLSLMLGCIYFFLEYAQAKEKSNRMLYLAFILCGLSVLANLIILNFYLTILIVVPLIELYKYNNSVLTSSIEIITPLKKFISNNKTWFLLNIVFIAFVLKRLFMLKNSGELYFGDKQNIWASTFKSIISGSLYSIDYGILIFNVISLFFLLTIILSVFLLLFDLIKNKTFQISSIFYLITLLSILFPILQNIFLGTPFPTQRTAVMYIPLFAISFIFCLNEFIILFKKPAQILISSLAILISFFSIYHCVKAMNLSKTYTFFEDCNTKEMMRDLYFDYNRDHQYEPVSIGINWLFEHSINYYKSTKQMDWLEPATRDGMSNKMYEYYYCHAWEKESIPEHDKLTIIKNYPETQTILVRRQNYRYLLLSKVVNFDSLPGKTPYGEFSMKFDSIPANSEIVLKIRPKSLITKDMKAFVIFFGAENWQEKLIFHEEIHGDQEIVLDRGSLKSLISPVLVYRNWQVNPTIPPIEIEIKIFKKI